MTNDNGLDMYRHKPFHVYLIIRITVSERAVDVLYEWRFLLNKPELLSSGVVGCVMSL